MQGIEGAAGQVFWLIETLDFKGFLPQRGMNQKWFIPLKLYNKIIWGGEEYGGYDSISIELSKYREGG